MPNFQNTHARRKTEKDSATGPLFEAGELPPDVNKSERGHSLLTQLIAGAVIAAAVVSFFYHPPKNVEYVYILAGGLLAIVVLTSAWFWIVASAVAAVALACTALACIIHFMIGEAVLAVFGTIAAVILLRVSVNRLLL